MSAITLQPPFFGGQQLEHVYRIANGDRQIAIFLPMAMRMSIREFQTSLDSCHKWKSGSRTTTLVVKLQQIA